VNGARHLGLAASIALVLAGAALAAPAQAGWPFRSHRQSGTLAELGARTAPLQRELPVTADALQAAEGYRAFLALPDGDPALRAEALRRLGDLQLAAAEADENNAATLAAAAVAAYATLLQQHPQAPGLDAATYQLARAHELSGDVDRSIATLDAFVTQHPDSRHYAEAQFRRGEALFAAGRYPEAERAYAAVLARGGDSEFIDASLYKQGWAFFRVGQDEASWQSFLGLIDRLLADGQGARRADTLSRPQRELLDDSLRALSISFMQGDGEASLAAALARHGPAPYEALLYRGLGDLYVDKQRFQDAAQTYRAYARRKPADDEAPLLLVAATEAYRLGGFDSLVLEGRREFVVGYGPDSAWWAEREGRFDPRVAAALQSDLLELARHHHAFAQQATAASADADEAIRWYRAYLRGFDAEPQAPATRLLLADLLFERERYAEAAGEYERAAYDYPASADSPRAAYAALVSYERAEAGMPAAEAPAWQARRIDASLRFVAMHPAHPEMPAVLTRTTQVLFEAGDRTRAAQLAAQVLELGPRAQPAQQRVAWNVIANVSFAEARYAEAERAYAELLARSEPADPARAEFTERLAASIYRQGEAKQAAGDTSGAVADWLRVAQAAPDSPIRASAEFDAATLLIAAQQWEQATQVLEAFRRDYSGDARVGDATQRLAVAYLEAGRPGQAATELERVAELPSLSTEQRRAAQWQAAESFAAAGDGAAAARAYATYVERHPQPLDPAMDARLALADLAQAAGNAVDRGRWLEQLVAADAAAGTDRSDRSRFLAAQASLELAAPLAANARALRLTLPLDRSLAAKSAALETALDAYRRSADYAIAAVTTEATWAMADLYRDLGKAVLDSERPRDLTAEELEQYDILLEEQAFPFEEKAIELHELNATRAAEGLFDESVRRSYQALAELKPGRYARAERRGEVTVDGIDALEAAVLAAPADAGLLNRLGVAYRETGRFAAAQGAYERAIAADPAAPAPECNLAILLDTYLGRTDIALVHYERCQALSGGADTQVAAWLVELRARLGQQQRTAEVTP
jgi:tetratricopeptide (TPR) repeat protein